LKIKLLKYLKFFFSFTQLKINEKQIIINAISKTKIEKTANIGIDNINK
jgi:hypothetical protein